MAAFLLLPAFNPFSESVSSFCISAGYTMQSILIMIIIASICYRYGASPIWLFGIERGVRQIFMLLGRDTSQALGSIGVAPANIEVVTSTLAVISIVAATMIFMSEKELSSNWGAVPVTPETQSILTVEPRTKTPAEKKHELATRVATVAREYKLSTREEEVLLLLGQRKTVGIIERELFIANGTAKAHVRHIYQKLDIHTRQELFDMLGIETEHESNKQSSTSS